MSVSKQTTIDHHSVAEVWSAVEIRVPLHPRRTNKQPESMHANDRRIDLPVRIPVAEHRISNAMAEGLNSKVATIQKRACGYRNASHFKVAVYFHCGGLDLWPRRWTHAKV